MIKSGSMYDKKLKKQREMKKKGMLTGGQAKIAAKAPPTNKIDEKDFAVLRAEKAKGRGMGLQDEKVKPGKTMKAALGAIALGLGAKKMKEKGKMMPFGLGATAALTKKKKDILGKRIGGVMKAKKGRQFFTARVTGDDDSFDKKMKLQKEGIINKKTGAGRERLTKAVKSVKFGKRLLAPIALGIGAVQYLKGKVKKREEKNKKTLKDFREQKKPGIPSEKTKMINKALTKKMGGGLMAATEKLKAQGKRRGGMGVLGGIGASSGRKLGKSASDIMAAAKRDKGKDEARFSKKMGGGMMNKPMGYMGGGMMKPMGYKAGKSVKAKCKLGRNKPTKMY